MHEVYGQRSSVLTPLQEEEEEEEEEDGISLYCHKY
jgi:hypothetical protein